MPLYEYKCSKCGKVFEVLQKFSDAPVKRHKDCGGSVKRLVSASSFQLKGGGWYASGYSKNAPATEGKSDGGSDGHSESKGDSKAESKSDSKIESKSAESKSESKSESKPAAKDSKPASAKSPAKSKE